MRKPRQNQPKEKLENLCQIISTLDSIRAFRRVEPKLVKESFQSVKSGEITQLWNTIKHDVEKIVYLPMEIPGLPRLMRLIAFLKLLTPLLSLLMIATLTFHLPYAKVFPTALREIFGHPAVLPIMVTLFSTALITYITVDQTIRRRVINYEENHFGKFSRGKERIKSVIEKLIVKLTEELKRNNEDFTKYKMQLFYKYEGLKVIKESRGRIIKRKYPVYTAICLTESAR